MRTHLPKHFFSKRELERIVQAIWEAESKTSGEIRVHLMRETKDDILALAPQVFEHLGMTKTQERNGVLILFGLKQKQFAVIGDKGIHEKVPSNFWQEIVQIMQKDFREDRFADGMAEGIKRIGEKLQIYFSAKKDNPNELRDRISYGRI